MLDICAVMLRMSIQGRNDAVITEQSGGEGFAEFFSRAAEGLPAVQTQTQTLNGLFAAMDTTAPVLIENPQLMNTDMDVIVVNPEEDIGQEDLVNLLARILGQEDNDGFLRALADKLPTVLGDITPGTLPDIDTLENLIAKLAAPETEDGEEENPLAPLLALLPQTSIVQPAPASGEQEAITAEQGIQPTAATSAKTADNIQNLRQTNQTDMTRQPEPAIRENESITENPLSTVKDLANSSQTAGNAQRETDKATANTQKTATQPAAVQQTNDGTAQSPVTQNSTEATRPDEAFPNMSKENENTIKTPDKSGTRTQTIQTASGQEPHPAEQTDIQQQTKTQSTAQTQASTQSWNRQESAVPAGEASLEATVSQTAEPSAPAAETNSSPQALTADSGKTAQAEAITTSPEPKVAEEATIPVRRAAEQTQVTTAKPAETTVANTENVKDTQDTAKPRETVQSGETESTKPKESAPAAVTQGKPGEQANEQASGDTRQNEEGDTSRTRYATENKVNPTEQSSKTDSTAQNSRPAEAEEPESVQKNATDTAHKTLSAAAPQTMDVPVSEPPAQSSPLRQAMTQTVIDQIVEAATLRDTAGGTTLEIELNPKLLGKITLELVSQNGELTAKLRAQDENVKNLLHAGLDGLKEQMKDAGIHMRDIEVSSGKTFAEQNNSGRDFARQWQGQRFNQNQNGSGQNGYTRQSYRNAERETKTLDVQGTLYRRGRVAAGYGERETAYDFRA